MATKKSRRRITKKKDKITNTIKNEIIGILIVGLACLGFVLLYTNNDNSIADVFIKFLRMGAGEGSAGIFIVLAAIGISFMGKNKRIMKMRMAGIFLLWLVFEGFAHLSLGAENSYSDLFEFGKMGQGGGLIGAGISILLLNLVGITGTYVILVFLAAIGSILTINRSLIGTFIEIFQLIGRSFAYVADQINDFMKVLADGEKERKEKKDKSKAAMFSPKKKTSRAVPEYDSELEIQPLVNYHPETQVDNIPEDYFSYDKNEPTIVPPLDINKTMVSSDTEFRNNQEMTPAVIGKLTGTPLSRQTEKNDNYQLPPLNLVQKSTKRGNRTQKNTAEMKLLEDTLASFGVKVKVTKVTQGPTITRYEVQPAPGVKVSKITSLSDDIALSLAARDVRIEAPIPGKSAVGIEVPNKEIAVVHFREVLESEDFQRAPSKLSIALGKDITGSPVVGDLTRMPHLLIAGATGSGKSVCINTLISSIVFKAKPEEVKLLLIDPKMVELTNYNGIPHLISPVVTDPQKAAGALKWIVTEMETRYELFAGAGVRDIVRYNYIISEKKENDQKSLPYVVVIIDELSDLMMVAPGDVEEAICRLAQMARAAGIHLIVATQRPSVDVITGLIKANIPSRIAFAVSSQIDSRTILDMGGAEKLLGRGDMLYHPIGMSKPLRVQGCFLADKEVKNIVDYLIMEGKPEYCEIPEISIQKTTKEEPEDELFHKAAQVFFENNTASVSLLQRRLRIGYTRAARIMDLMEEKGVVGKYEGSKPRELLLTKGQFDLKYGNADEL